MPLGSGADTVGAVRAIATIAAVLAAFVVAGCGGNDKADQAKADVCSARDNISKEVNTLKGLTISTATLNQVQDSLKAIGDNLTTIKNARANLSEDRRNQVDEANKNFESQVKSTFSDLGTSSSIADAKTQLQQAFQSLASTYQQTYAKIDC
jgi:hypothetical protein